MILIEKQLKYQHYYQAILINVYLFKLEKYYLLVHFKRLNKLNLLIRLEKAYEKQTKTIEDQKMVNELKQVYFGLM